MGKTIVLLVISAVIVLSACSQKQDESCEAPLNPNGDSELALLMREMTTHLEQEKIRIEKGEAPSQQPDFNKILTGKPSDPGQLGENHQSLAKVYLESLTAYHSAKPENYKFAFNNLVKSCISCHNEECPGPIRRIEKLMVVE